MTRQDKKLLSTYRELLEEFRVKLEDSPDTEYQKVKAIIGFVKERLIRPLEVEADDINKVTKRDYL